MKTKEQLLAAIERMKREKKPPGWRGLVKKMCYRLEQLAERERLEKP